MRRALGQRWQSNNILYISEIIDPSENYSVVNVKSWIQLVFSSTSKIILVLKLFELFKMQHNHIVITDGSKQDAIIGC